MIGSAAVAGWIAHLAFWILLARVAFDVHKATTAAFLLLWIGGYIVLNHAVAGELFFMPWVAVLDIALAFTLKVKDS